MKILVENGDDGECAECEGEISSKSKMIYCISPSADEIYLHYKCASKFIKKIKEAIDRIKQENLIKKIAGI